MVGLLTLVTFFLAEDAFARFFTSGGDQGDGMLVTVILVALVALGIAALVWIYRSKSDNPLMVKSRGIVSNLWDGMASIARMEGKWQFIVYTVLIWSCYYMQLYLASKAFSFTADLGAVPVLVLFVLSSIGMAVPSNGGLGPWQFAIIFGLALYGVGAFPLSTPYDPQASAFAWLVWGVQQLLLIVLGIFAFACIALERRKDPDESTETKQDKQ